MEGRDLGQDEAQPNTGRRLAQHGGQRAEEQNPTDMIAGHDHLAARGAGMELARRPQTVVAVEHVAEFAHDGAATLRLRHAIGAGNKQRVVKEAAQPGECMADGRLVEGQPARGDRDGTIFADDLEHSQGCEVHLVGRCPRHGFAFLQRSGPGPAPRNLAADASGPPPAGRSTHDFRAIQPPDEPHNFLGEMLTHAAKHA